MNTTDDFYGIAMRPENYGLPAGPDAYRLPMGIIEDGWVTAMNLVPEETRASIVKVLVELRAVHANNDPTAFERAVLFVASAIEDANSEADEW